MTMIESYTTRMYVWVTVFTFFSRDSCYTQSAVSVISPQDRAAAHDDVRTCVPITHVSSSVVEYR